MGNIPSMPQRKPVPVPVPIPINSVKKDVRRFRDFARKHTEKIINEYLTL